MSQAPVNTAALKAKLDAVARMGRFEPAEIAAFERFISEAPEQALFRTNPIRYAALEKLSETRAIDLFLFATHAGLFELSWGVICGGCGAYLHTLEGLRELARDQPCGLCELSSPGSLDDNVEVAFTLSPAIRPLRYHDPVRLIGAEDGLFTFFSTSVDHDPEVARQNQSRVLENKLIEPHSIWEIQSDHDVPRLSLLAPESHALAHLEVEAGGAAELDLDFIDGRFVPDSGVVAPGRRIVRVHHRGGKHVRASFFIGRERPVPGAVCPIAGNNSFFTVRPFLTGKRLLTSQTFRDLFRAQSMPAEGGMALQSLTLLFTDLKGSTQMYERIGDIEAYRLVREHFDVLREVVSSRGGAVVKTIGDAIMATFSEPNAALEAAATMNREISKVGAAGDLVLKIGVHAGPCIAVESNDRLDYFGQTVNIAARVQGIAEAREIVCTEAIFSTPGAQQLIAAAGLVAKAESASLKGMEARVPVYRLS